MSMSNEPYVNQARVFPRRVFFTGSTALYKGMGLCYDRDFTSSTTGEAATDKFGGRDKRVELPSSSNNRWFAGVVAEDKPAKSGGQWVDIYEPGSVCEIAVLVATTNGSTRLTACAGSGSGIAGYFVPVGFNGRGSAQAMNTLTAATGPTDYSQTVIGSGSIDGSATYTSSTKTVTKTGAFTNVPATANLQGNEYVVVLAGAQDNVGSGASVMPTPGFYKITAKTSDDAVVVDSAICTADCDLAFYVTRGRPTVLAKLEEGEESGLVEYIGLYTDGTTTTANAAMTGGTTRVFGGFDLDVGDSVDTLANGDHVGLRKQFHLLAAITTNDHLVSVTSGVQLDGSTALNSMEFDGADDRSVLEWGGASWRLLHNSGTGLA